jgi:dCTP diphosphatase
MQQTGSTDSDTTIQDLKDQVTAFRDERDWRQFHNPKDLAAAIAIEASELQELFLWKPPEQASSLHQNPVKREAIANELADVLIFSLSLADVLRIDLSAAVSTKIEHNAAKYPVASSRSRSDKYTELES